MSRCKHVLRQYFRLSFTFDFFKFKKDFLKKKYSEHNKKINKNFMKETNIFAVFLLYIEKYFFSYLVKIQILSNKEYVPFLKHLMKSLDKYFLAQHVSNFSNLSFSNLNRPIYLFQS